MILQSLEKLRNYIESEHFKGYDPYDTLNSHVPFYWLGKWGPILAIQSQKINPINIRQFFGIKKGYNPKAMGLFLHAYSILYAKTNKKEYLDKADYFFEWLKENYSNGYSGYCWGYNFDWASPAKYLEAYTPSIVVTGFISKGIFEYYQITKDKKAFDVLQSVCDFILNDIPITEMEKGICFSYTPIKIDCCYNASILGAEIFAKVYSINKDKKLLVYAQKAIDFIIDKEKDTGFWNYSIDLESGRERKQIDFHQGYILESLCEFIKYSGIYNEKYNNALEKGAIFYKNEQFFENGQSKWRLPKIYPIDIHNQSQGVITFSKLNNLYPGYLNFAKTILEWTIENMQDKIGYFYYQKNKFYLNKIPYMRWSQAWMMLALATLLIQIE